MMTRKFLLTLFLLVTSCTLLATGIYAKEITILYTGQTHAMLYPCNCPKEQDGGVGRRAALLKQLRKNNPDTLVLDSGGFFAGGLMDEYTQNTELDSQRSKVNLKAMELMQYDAVSIGDDEFNFGKDFLEENLAKTKITFLSCNIKSNKLLPYIIKEISGTKIGIIGVTSISALQKAGGLEFVEPRLAVQQQVEELKKKNTDIIILLSHLDESEDLNLIKDTPGIDILVAGHRRTQEALTKVGSTLVVMPAWQARRLGKLSLTIKDNKIANYKVEELRLWDKIKDDPDILSILPQCFSDANCKKQGFIGVCQDSGTTRSRCMFNEATKVNLLIITSKDCRICQTQGLVNYLKQMFPGLTASYLYYPDTRANKLIKDFRIKALPVYLLGKEIEKEKGFGTLKENLEGKGDFYMLKPQVSGISYFLDRKNIKGNLDLFISLYDKDAARLLEAIKEFKPTIHFLTVEQNDRFDATKGDLEVQEYLRSVCVQKYYPEYFWDYISCRAKFINSSWWEDCLGNLDTNRIKYCAKGEEGKTLLKGNIRLNRELGIMFGPTYLLDNQEVFSSQGAPTKEELRKIIKR